MVFQINELVMLAISTGTLIYTVTNLAQLKKMPFYKFLLFSFFLFFAATVFTNMEAVFWSDVLNVLEHISYAISSVALLVWCKKTYFDKERQEQ